MNKFGRLVRVHALAYACIVQYSTVAARNSSVCGMKLCSTFIEHCNALFSYFVKICHTVYV
jgi:hypothetical protein